MGVEGNYNTVYLNLIVCPFWTISCQKIFLDAEMAIPAASSRSFLQ